MDEREALYYATQQSNLIEGEATHGLSFDNHWRCTLLAATAASAKQLLHPRVYHRLLFEGITIDFDHVIKAGEYRTPGIDAYVNQADDKRLMFTTGNDVAGQMALWWDEWLQRETWFDGSRREHECWTFHAWFESIHPFVDGNGRVGRLMMWNMNMIVGMQLDVPTFSKRNLYYDRLDAWRKEHWPNGLGIPEVVRSRFAYDD